MRVSALLDLAPPTARVIRDDGSESDVPAAQVTIGDRFVVRGGDRIPLDGEVTEGRGDVDQAPNHRRKRFGRQRNRR